MLKYETKTSSMPKNSSKYWNKNKKVLPFWPKFVQKRILAEFLKSKPENTMKYYYYKKEGILITNSKKHPSASAPSNLLIKYLLK